MTSPSDVRIAEVSGSFGWVLLKGQMAPLAAEARRDGIEFVDRLAREWESGKNRFELPGEKFFLALDGDDLVGFCGLNVDPFAHDPSLGRLRHLYVRADRRGEGIGRRLVERALAAARERFRRVRLRAGPPGAPGFWDRLGFAPSVEPDATHELRLTDGPEDRSGNGSPHRSGDGTP